MRSKPTSRVRALAAFVFAPGPYAFAAVAFWLVVAAVIDGGVRAGLGLTDNASIPVTLYDMGNGLHWSPPPSNAGPYVERWECVVHLSEHHLAYGTRWRATFDITARTDAAGADLGAPSAPRIEEARFAAVTAPQFQGLPVIDGGVVVPMLIKGETSRWATSPHGRAIFAVLVILRLIPILAAGVFLVRGVRWVKYQRRHARCLRGECPVCRYSLRDLTAPTCPECGCDTTAACLEAARLLRVGRASEDEDEG